MLSEQSFARWQAFMLDRAGQYFSPNKAYLFEQRLVDLYDKTNSHGLDLLYEKVCSQPGSELERSIIEAMTTHETSFFRDGSPFELFRHMLRANVHQGGSRKLKLFSAGCSTGEEAYSLAMILDQELARHPQYSWNILAWDIAEQTLKKARMGVYRNLDQLLSWDLVDTYFEKIEEGSQVVPRLRKQIDFKNRNLVDVNQIEERFHFIFCRYVGIYFSPEHRKQLFRELAERLEPGGILMVGACESIRGLDDVLQRLMHRRVYYYQKR